MHWALLHAYLRGGLATAAPLIRRVRQLNSHRFGGRTPRAGDYPGAPPFPDTEQPSTFDTTIVDVALDGGFPAAGYEERVRSWAADTTSAWQAGAAGGVTPRPSSG